MDNGRGERQDDCGLPSLLIELLGYSSEGEPAVEADGLAHEPQNVLAQLARASQSDSADEFADFVPANLDPAETTSGDFAVAGSEVIEIDGEITPEITSELHEPILLDHPFEILSTEDETELLLAQLSALTGDDSPFAAGLGGFAFGLSEGEAPAEDLLSPEGLAFEELIPEELVSEEFAGSDDSPSFDSLLESEPLLAAEVVQPESEPEPFVPEPVSPEPTLQVAEEFKHVLHDTDEFRIPAFEIPAYLMESPTVPKAEPEPVVSASEPFAEKVDPLADTMELQIPRHLFEPVSGDDAQVESPAQAEAANWSDDDLLSQLQALVGGPIPVPAEPEPVTNSQPASGEDAALGSPVDSDTFQPAPDGEEDLLLAQLLGTWEGGLPGNQPPSSLAAQQPAAAEALVEPDLAFTDPNPEISDDDFLASVLAGVAGISEDAAEIPAVDTPYEAVAQSGLDLSGEMPSFEELLNFGAGITEGNDSSADATPVEPAENVPSFVADISGSDLLLGDLLSGLGSEVEPDQAQPVRYVPKNKPAEKLPDARQELERIVATTDAEIASLDGGLFRERRSLDLNANRHIAFQAGRRLFALPLESVLETDMVPRITFVPGSGGAIRGVANVRGDLLSVVDLRDLLSIEQHDRVHERLLVVRHGKRAVAGFIIDNVLGIVPVRTEDRQPVPAAAGDPAAAMLDAVVEYRDRLMGVLDAGRLVTAAGLEVSQTN